MPGHRFYISKENFTPTSVVMSGDEAHHLRKVLRLRLGDEVQVFDGLGQEWLAVVEQFSGQNVSLELKDLITTEVESPLEITLVQGLIKGDRFDWLIQKAVELGVSKIQPLVTEYTDIQPVKNQADKKIERWQRIALEATKQSGRRLLTTIHSPIEWPSLLTRLQGHGTTIFFAERGGNSLNKIVAKLKQEPITEITLIVGSEGGWSDEELSQATNTGFYLATLGRRILRAETAGITATALLQHLLGDLD